MSISHTLSFHSNKHSLSLSLLYTVMYNLCMWFLLLPFGLCECIVGTLISCRQGQRDERCMFMALQVLCTDISVECFSLPLSLSLSSVQV